MPYLLIPNNLDMNQFGDDSKGKDCIAFICNRIYRGCITGADYNQDGIDFKAVPIHYDTLRKAIKDRPKQFLTKIAISPDNPKPLVPLLQTDGYYKKGESSKKYSFTKEFEVSPTRYEITQEYYDKYVAWDEERLRSEIEKIPEPKRSSYKAV